MLTRREFAAAAALAATGRPPNILTILCDQLNASVTSVYGGPVPTPNLERLARQGVVFTNATCPTPFCSPSRASLVTGRWPHAHGIVHNVSRIDYPPFRRPRLNKGS
jgi:arylsulfatase A-like enzyme